jgi:opacity protein-like surface antigen
MCRLRILVVGLILAVTASTPAFAGLGFHAGAAVDPDMFLLGLRFKSHPIQESIFIVPNAEVGFGDVTMVAGNLDAYYSIKTSSDLSPYLGGGLSLNWFDYDGGSNTEFGGCILGGIYLKPTVFFETKLGLGDVPDWKFIIGWNK